MAQRTSPKPTADDDPTACCAPGRPGRDSIESPLPLDPATAEVMARRFAALGDPVRLRLLSMIEAAGEVCSCDLVEPLGKSQPTVSHHTRILAEAGLIEGERRGRWVWWRIAPDELSGLGAIFNRA